MSTSLATRKAPQDHLPKGINIDVLADMMDGIEMAKDVINAALPEPTRHEYDFRIHTLTAVVRGAHSSPAFRKGYDDYLAVFQDVAWEASA